MRESESVKVNAIGLPIYDTKLYHKINQYILRIGIR